MWQARAAAGGHGCIRRAPVALTSQASIPSPLTSSAAACPAQAWCCCVLVHNRYYSGLVSRGLCMQGARQAGHKVAAPAAPAGSGEMGGIVPPQTLSPAAPKGGRCPTVWLPPLRRPRGDGAAQMWAPMPHGQWACLRPSKGAGRDHQIQAGPCTRCAAAASGSPVQWRAATRLERNPALRSPCPSRAAARAALTCAHADTTPRPSTQRLQRRDGKGVPGKMVRNDTNSTRARGRT